MSEKFVSKSVFSLNVSEVQTGDGGKDYLINASVRSGAVNFQFEATIDQVRTFFTERRERRVKAEEMAAIE